MNKPILRLILITVAVILVILIKIIRIRIRILRENVNFVRQNNLKLPSKVHLPAPFTSFSI